MRTIEREIGRALLRQLSGFRGYPKGEGENRFVDTLCGVAVSVEHAVAVIETFDGEFPTVREMRDTAYSLRPKFEAQLDQRAQWRKEYGAPDVGWSKQFAEKAAGVTAKLEPLKRKQQHTEEKRAMLWQAIRDALYYTRGGLDGFWSAAIERLKREHAADIESFRVQLGQSTWDALMAFDWMKGKPGMSACVAQQAARQLGDGE